MQPLFLIAIAVFPSIVLCQITLDDINDLRTELREEFDESGRFRDLLSATVRLIFHDCSGPEETTDGIVYVSQCNGCIDFDNDDHAGLPERVIELDDIYNISGWSELMSRADFWAAAGTIAIEYATELDTTNTNDALPAIPYYFGRVDCGETSRSTQTKSFPAAKAGWDETSLWFSDNLGLDERETVAIIGAHTLGRAHVQFSGYSSLPWVTFDDGPDVLNNQFYINLLNENWTQSQSATGLWEFRDASDSLLMLNADMCLVIDMDPYLNDTGKVSCPDTGCPVSSVIDIVTEYANDNQLWLNDFANVFEKLILTGYNVDDLTVIGGENETEKSTSTTTTPSTSTSTPTSTLIATNKPSSTLIINATNTDVIDIQSTRNTLENTASITDNIDNDDDGPLGVLNEYSGVIALIAAVGVVILSCMICCFIMCRVCRKNENDGGDNGGGGLYNV